MNINYTTRQLIRSSSKGYFSTEFDPSSFSNKNIRIKDKFPYSTFTLVAFDYDLSPILLFSDLSEHTTNLKKNNLVSLMVCEEEKVYQLFPKFKKQFTNYEDPMSRPRITLIGEIKISNNKQHKKRFLNRHPAAKLYSNFQDMNFYVIKIKSAHLVGGFAQVKWFGKNDLINTNTKNFSEMESEIIDHMNSYHKDSIDLYALKILKLRTKGWTMSGIDPDGFDLRKKGNLARFNFEKTVDNAKKLRGILVSLHKKALKV